MNPLPHPLKPADRTTIKNALYTLNALAPHIEALDALGHDATEEKARVEHLNQQLTKLYQIYFGDK